MTVRQQGFSLPDVLCALLLFAVVITLLLDYHRGLQQGFEAQWQTRQIWRYALEQTEPESPPLPDGWQRHKKQIPCGDALCVHVTITSPQGRKGQLSKQIYRFPQFNQE